MSVTSVYVDGTSPNDYNAHYEAENVIRDSLNQTWRSIDVANGIHALDFDLGTAADLDLVTILNHNFGDVTIGTTFKLVLKAKNNIALSWTTPNLEIDFSAKKDDEKILIWLPASTSYRYWRIHIEADTVAGVTYFQIGRAILTTMFTPTYDFHASYKWGRRDPSVRTRTEGNAQVVRVRSDFQRVDFRFHLMTLADQETLLSLFAASNGGPWLVLFDPDDEPIDWTIYGYMDLDIDEQRLSGGEDEWGDVDLSIEEIVA